MPLSGMDRLLDFLCYDVKWVYDASDGYVEDGGWYGGMYGWYGMICILEMQPIRLRMSMYECKQQGS